MAILIFDMKAFIRLFATVESIVNMAHFSNACVCFSPGLTVQLAHQTWRETNVNIVKMGYIYNRFLLTLTLTLMVYLPPSYQGHCPCSGGPF